jgi:hypothetical protein
MSTQQSYDSNMRVIGYLYNTLRDDYGTMEVEDFNELSGQINRLFQQSCELLPSANPEVEVEAEVVVEEVTEPIQSRRYTLFDRVRAEMDNFNHVRTDMETQNAFQTPPPAQQSVDPPPIESNPSQSNVTMTRGENVIDLSFQDDMPMELEELDNPDDSSALSVEDEWLLESSDEYQEYLAVKTKPKLTSKFFSIKEGREKTSECIICCEEHNLHQTLTLGCGHEFCKMCVCDHFHHSVENQPYKRFYACPICRADVKQVRVNYSKMNAAHKTALMSGPLVTYMKTWCK